MNIPAIALDNLAAIQHAVTFNELAAAECSAALFGVRQSKTNGLTLSLYGGMYPTGAGPVQVADTKIALTASATNYIYADTAGVVTTVTVAPTDWPGPMSTGYRALYELTVGANSITSGINYRVGANVSGPTGEQGAVGAVGADWHTERRKAISWAGDSSTLSNFVGADTVTVIGGSYLSWGTGDSNTDSIMQAGIRNNSTAANITSGIRSPRNFCTRGDAARRGGFDVRMRWSHNQVQLASMRCFAGLYDTSAGSPSASADPSALLNIVGVGIDTADAGNDLYLMHNDSSGTATKTLITGFGARKNDVTGDWPVYDLRLWCDAFASNVNWSLHNQYNATSTSGNITTDLPDSTAFLGFLLYTNTGPTGGTVCYPNPMQLFAATRY